MYINLFDNGLFHCFRHDVPALLLEDTHLPSEHGFAGIQESFFEYLDLNFWKNTAEKTNLFSVETRVKIPQHDNRRFTCFYRN